MAIDIPDDIKQRLLNLIRNMSRRGYDRDDILYNTRVEIMRHFPQSSANDVKESAINLVNSLLGAEKAEVRNKRALLKREKTLIEENTISNVRELLRRKIEFDPEDLAVELYRSLDIAYLRMSDVKEIVKRLSNQLIEEYKKPLREREFKKRLKEEREFLLEKYNVLSEEELSPLEMRNFNSELNEIRNKLKVGILGESEEKQKLETAKKEHRKRLERIHEAKSFPEERQGFWNKPVWKREEERTDWYKSNKESLRKRLYQDRQKYYDQIAYLKGRLAAGQITKDQYKEEKQAAKTRFRQKRDLIYHITKSKKDRAYGEPGAKRGGRFLGRGLRNLSAMREHPSYSGYIVRLAWVIALLIVGMFTFSFSSFFLWGCLALALYFIFPDPREYFKPDPTPLGFGDIFNPFGAGRNKKHNGVAIIKSAAKVTAIIMFAMAFRSLGDTFNILFIATAFIGYFALKNEYDPQYPGEFIESLLRFVVLGAYFIPFWVFGSIFQSYVLVAIAFAFFAIPPMPKPDVKNIAEVLSRALLGATTYYKMFDTVIFIALMGFALGGALVGFPGWGLEGALEKTFIYFWVVSFISGLFSPPSARPITGILMLGGATIIYGIGPGSQEVGTALLGQWWPVVHNGVTDVMEPVVGVFDQFGQTFGNAFLLLTNPVGYATSILNGTYAENPTGKTGAFGVEINDFTVSPVFIEQPFIVTVNIKNEGAFPANFVTVRLRTNNETAPLETPSGQGFAPFPGTSPSLPPLIRTQEERLSIDDMNFRNVAFIVPLGSNGLIQQDSRSLLFQSDGLSCGNITRFDLRRKFIPLVAQVDYQYEVASELEVRFIEETEWERLILDRLLYPRQKPSTISTSPVKLSIGTLDQPIRGGTPFHIGMVMNSQEGKNSQIKDALIQMDFPVNNGFVLQTRTETTESGEQFIVPECTSTEKLQVQLMGSLVPYYLTTNKEAGLEQMMKGNLLWKFDKPEEIGTIICQFAGINLGRSGGGTSEPSKTFLVSANATFNFSKWEEEETRVEFTGTCPEVVVSDGTIPSGLGDIPMPQYRDYILRAERSTGVPAALIAAVIAQESSWDYRAISAECGAAGLMQFMPGTASQYGLGPIFEDSRIPKCDAQYAQRLINAISGKSEAEAAAIDQRFNPQENIRAGAEFLRDLISKFGSSENYKYAIAGYYGGVNTPDPQCNNQKPVWECQQKQDVIQHVANVQERIDIYIA